MIKRIRRTGIAATAAFIVLLAVSGCATTIKTNVLMPGRIDEAAQFKSVAVLSFEGTGGREFSSLVESSLASVRIDDKQYFQIVDRSVMDKTLGEMKLSMTGVVDADTAARIGRMIGAKGIYTGTVNTSSVNDSGFTEARKKCGSYRTVTDGKGKKSQECAEWYDTKVECTRRTTVFTFTPKLVEVETSRIIFSNTYESALESKGCKDESKGLADGEVMKKQARGDAIQKFRMDVAPYYTMMEFTLKDSAADIPADAAKNKLKDGMKFAQGGRMDRACELWNDAKGMAPNSITLLYNLGVCAETQGRPEEALALYRQVDRALTRPDELVNKALERVSAQIENRKKLGQQVKK